VKQQQVIPSTVFEDEARRSGADRIAGIDEAGRGPLAGPVVAAAVILRERSDLPGLRDSKMLTKARREDLFYRIQEQALAIGLGFASAQAIDKINILQATRLAMARAVQQIHPIPDYLLVDGPIKLDLPVPQRAIVQGDRLSVSVAAAAIIAKVSRDRIMLDLHRRFPQYGFDRHQGYPTKAHREALLRYGPCPEHRLCFRGVVLEA
jgi:ribonuclease HII